MLQSRLTIKGVPCSHPIPRVAVGPQVHPFSPQRAAAPQGAPSSVKFAKTKPPILVPALKTRNSQNQSHRTHRTLIPTIRPDSDCLRARGSDPRGGRQTDAQSRHYRTNPFSPLRVPAQLHSLPPFTSPRFPLPPRPNEPICPSSSSFSVVAEGRTFSPVRQMSDNRPPQG
jgi:hypothetical protein